jgi:hypothetical protein
MIQEAPNMHLDENEHPPQEGETTPGAEGMAEKVCDANRPLRRSNRERTKTKRLIEEV